MTIYRDGQPIELTGQELRQAYEEMQDDYDQEDVQTLLDAYDDDELFDLYELTREELEAAKLDMACEMRRNINKYDMHWDYAREEAVRVVARKLVEEKETCTT